jgi:chromosome segregation protein
MDKGAHFHRCDLQVHTPRDHNWAGDDAVADDQRQAYANQLVQACRSRSLQGIAITDHHDMAFVEYIRRAAADEADELGTPLPKQERIVVFPGMELTLGVPCQALLIFDADFPADLFALAMTALAINPNPNGDAKTANVERLQHIHSLKQLKDKLDEHTYLRDRYIILPNVGESGQFSLLRKGLAGKYVEMPCVGGYVDGSHEKLGDGNRKIVAGLAKEWGHKRIALFQTSDSRRDDHRELGTFSTWIKWATPTAEALRQACLAQESRVSQVEPVLPSVGITSISISNSVFLGPVDLEVNFQYNALIGGRGTGKSTLLEYLRWALCDQPPGISDEDTPNYQVRRARLIEQTLKPVNATVQVSYEVNGVPHIVRRDSRDGSLQLKIASADMRACSEEEVRALLPIQGYSQKQLSGVSVRIDELSRFITAPIRSELNRNTQQSADRAERIRQTYATRRRQRTLARTLDRRALEERSLSEQADAIKSSLTGLSDDDRAIIAKGKSFDSADQAIQSWRDGIRTFKSGAEGLLATVASSLIQSVPAPSEPDPDMLQAARAEQQSLLAEAQTALDTLIAKANGILETSDSDSPWRKWAASLAAFKDDYSAAVGRSSTHAERMTQLRQIEEQLIRHVRETARMREELRGVESAEAIYETERRSWLTLRRERDELMQAQCASLTASSDGMIRAHVKPYADPSEFVNSLRQFLSGSRISGGKIEALGEIVASAADGVIQWNAVLVDLEKLAEIDPENESNASRPETPSLSAAGMTVGEIDRLARSLKPDQWLALSLVPIPSVPVFEYRARENEYIPFGNASAGQQATALLKTLLNQVGPPLIIDQPEEDLDNPVMLEIVKQLWTAKQKRQIIFASHNANLVVNGDAELVAWCDYRTSGEQSRGFVAGEGAIDVPNVREAVERIMEGGKAAFNLRREKYGF